MTDRARALREAVELRGLRPYASLRMASVWTVKDMPDGKIPKAKLLEQLKKSNRERRAALTQASQRAIRENFRKGGIERSEGDFHYCIEARTGQ